MTGAPVYARESTPTAIVSVPRTAVAATAGTTTLVVAAWLQHRTTGVKLMAVALRVNATRTSASIANPHRHCEFMFPALPDDYITILPLALDCVIRIIYLRMFGKFLF